ncbi:DnaJ like chaperone protein [Thorsellia anophelis DSM 18579]|uniref:Co-chaperone protein DjlA n=2 Tax=Thorsellia anophelis TaxID=336804 RepID=A0A1H9Y2G9_9GAMM|nr:DnaJ like chaperone protein [Thorsellia anophelis DSM 18579]
MRLLFSRCYPSLGITQVRLHEIMKQHLGKIVGVILALIFKLGFIGVICCLILGHLIDRSRKRSLAFEGDERYLDRQQVFFTTTFQVMGHLSKAKGVITERDIEMANSIMDRFDLYDDQRRVAQEAYRFGKEPDFPLRKVMRDLRLSLGRRFDLIKIFLEIQLQVALADGVLHEKEKDVLMVIANELGIGRQFESILNMLLAGNQFGQNHQGANYSEQRGFSSSTSKIKEAYTILGIAEQSDAVVIKRAYRKLMSEHHPDKLVAKGLPPEMMEMAKEKAQTIQAAYELLKNHIGFK